MERWKKNLYLLLESSSISFLPSEAFWNTKSFHYPCLDLCLNYLPLVLLVWLMCGLHWMFSHFLWVLAARAVFRDIKLWSSGWGCVLRKYLTVSEKWVTGSPGHQSWSTAARDQPLRPQTEASPQHFFPLATTLTFPQLQFLLLSIPSNINENPSHSEPGEN